MRRRHFSGASAFSAFEPSDQGRKPLSTASVGAVCRAWRQASPHRPGDPHGADSAVTTVQLARCFGGGHVAKASRSSSSLTFESVRLLPQPRAVRARDGSRRTAGSRKKDLDRGFVWVAFYITGNDPRYVVVSLLRNQ